MQEKTFSEKRQYVRMNTVFPVEAEILTASGKPLEPRALFQAFTSNVSAGGMCLEFRIFDRINHEMRFEPGLALQLTIHTPFANDPILAQARLIWIRKQTTAPEKYFVGISYKDIDDQARRRILRYAKQRVWFPKVFSGCVLILLILAGFYYVHHQRLAETNERLVHRLVDKAQQKSQLALRLHEILLRRRMLDRENFLAKEKIHRLENTVMSMARKTDVEKALYEKELKANIEKQKDISNRLKQLRQSDQRLKNDLIQLKQTTPMERSLMVRQMTGWLSSHQNVRTGLVTSFEGDKDLEDQAFTYDQALVAQAFMLQGDFTRTRAILDFYNLKAKRSGGLFCNAYDASSGAVSEQSANSGPSIWIAISAAQYTMATKNREYMEMAESVGKWVTEHLDNEGGLSGGAGISWFSTEHNLDAYALLGMLDRLTQTKEYAQAQGRVLEWLRRYAYSNKGIIRRGKADATIATDTFSWSIAAIGPKTLEENGYDTKEILDFAQENCQVAVDYRQDSGGIMKVSGFDFARSKNLGRGGVISTEWTAQMIVAYRVMSDYLTKSHRAEQANVYRRQENFYLNELQKMMITSPSRIGRGRGCLPYASTDNIDTGHGWRTPKGSRTGSVAATAYAIFAATGYNPMDSSGGTAAKKS